LFSSSLLEKKINKNLLEQVLGTQIEDAEEKVLLNENISLDLIKIFQNSFICESLTPHQIEDLKLIEGNWKLATLDGKLLVTHVDGICEAKRFADFDGKQGIIFRNNEIVRLKSELNLLQQQTAEKEDLKDKYQKELEELKSKQSHWQKVYGESKTALALIKAEVDNLSLGLEKDKSKLEELRLKKSSTSKEKLSLIEKEEILNQKIDDLKDLLETRQGVLEDLQESYNIKKITYSDEKEKLILKQTEVKTYEQRLNSLKSQIEDIEKQIERYELRHVSNEEQIVALRDEVIRTGEELDLLKITNHDDASVLSRQEKGLLEGKRELTKIVDLIEEKDKSIRNFALKINKLEKDILVFKTKMEQFIVDEELCVRNIFEKYRINLRQVIGNHLGLSSEDLKEFADLSSMFYMETETGPQLIETVPYEFNRKYGQELESAKEKFRRYQREIQLLGEINWSAVEEYNRQKKRYDFFDRPT
jgi:chromosome segregation protein